MVCPMCVATALSVNAATALSCMMAGVFAVKMMNHPAKDQDFKHVKNTIPQNNNFCAVRPPKKLLHGHFK